MKRYFKLLALILVFTFVVSLGLMGCAKKEEPKKEEPKKEEPAPAETKKPKVGIVLSSGGKGDKSFNDAALRGLDMAKAEGIIDDYHYTEPPDISKDEESLRFYAEEGYDLVIGVGFMMETAMKNVAEEFSKTNFAIIDAVVDKPNVASLVFKEEEGSFLAGALAAMITTSKMPMANDQKVVGFVGGMDMPLIHKFQGGFEQGVKYIDDSIQVIAKYAGTEPSAFNDPPKGKELAKAEIEAGADVIYHASGGTGAGVFEAAEENNIYAIGVDSDQNWMKPGFIIASMLKKVDVAVFETTKAVAENRFKAGVQVFDTKADGVGLTDLENLTVVEKQAKEAGDITDEQLNKIKEMKNSMPQEFKEKIKEIREKIISGEIKVIDVTAKK